MIRILVFVLLLSSQFVYAQSLVINEVMSSNSSIVYDENGDASDWIELYNNSSVQINLEGYYLSDDSLNVTKWQFGNEVIEPGEYLLIFTSDKDTHITYWHTNFKINASGEKIILSDPDSSIVDQVYIPESPTDISYGRKSDGSLPWIFQTPSPGLQNTGNQIIGNADSVSVSIPGGFYTSSVSVELSAGNSEIFYTLDGSNPDAGSSKYTGSININKTTVLKAISMKDGFLPSPTIYQTYFINEQTNLPVISLICDPYDLFDAAYGIYPNYTMNWERPAHIQFYEADKTPGFSENCGIEIFGSQSATWDQKSLSIEFKNQYGISKLEYPLFPDFHVKTFKSFVLRNSGNDWQYTHIRDAVMQALVKDEDIDYLEYRPAVTFINGEYWGIYNIREKANEDYVANRHGVDPDDIDLLENNMESIQGDSIAYQQLIDYMSINDLTTEAAYVYLDSVIDLDECILYFAAQAYYDNMDWPGTNIKFWRERSITGKWRWILFGLDFGFGLYSHGPWEDHVQFMFSPVETRYSNPPWSTFFQRKLVENQTIRNRFINQISDLLNTNFKSERVVNVINSLANHISSEISKHRSRWNLRGDNLNKLTDFAQQRPAFLRDHVRNYFKCGSDGQIKVNATEGGTVQLNTLNLKPNDLPFTGIYFRNNEVHLKAIPSAGFKFNGWSGSVTSHEQTISLSVTGSTNLTAAFSIDSSFTNDIVINEINYNSSEEFDSGDWIELFNRSEQTADLSGWYFSDSDSSHKFTLPSGTVMEPGSYLVLVENDSAFASRFSDVTNYIGETGFGLNGSGEFIKIVNNVEQIIDSLTYDDILPWPAEADGLGATLELVDVNAENSRGENWRASKEHGTPGKVNSVLTAVDKNDPGNIPAEYVLHQNYPNPFNPTTIIEYQTAKYGFVSLKVYDVLGNEVVTLVNEEKPAGSYRIQFNAEGLSSGVYFYRMQSANVALTRKLILMR